MSNERKTGAGLAAASGSAPWVDLKKSKPAKGSRVLVCDDNGYVTIENVEDVMNVHVGKMTWLQSWKFGNGTRLRYWMPLPKVPADIEGDGEMPSWR